MHWTVRVSRVAGTMLAIVVVTFAAELVVMFGLTRWLGSVWQPRLVLLDAVVLALVIAPPVYFLVLRPLRREYERRLEAERRANEADRLAITDPLTEVLNRRGIKAALLEAMARADRYERALSVAMLDLDGFKEVNDRHGHAVGDEALRGVVHVVRQGLRTPDRLGRFGGDEFLILLPETPLPAAQVLTARVAALLRDQPVEVGDHRLDLAASIGAVEFRRGESLEALLGRVDRALYQAKRARSERPREPALAGTDAG